MIDYARVCNATCVNLWDNVYNNKLNSGAFWGSRNWPAKHHSCVCLDNMDLRALSNIWLLHLDTVHHFSSQFHIITSFFPSFVEKTHPKSTCTRVPSHSLICTTKLTNIDPLTMSSGWSPAGWSRMKIIKVELSLYFVAVPASTGCFSYCNYVKFVSYS